MKWYYVLTWQDSVRKVRILRAHEKIQTLERKKVFYLHTCLQRRLSQYRIQKRPYFLQMDVVHRYRKYESETVVIHGFVKKQYKRDEKTKKAAHRQQ